MSLSQRFKRLNNELVVALVRTFIARGIAAIGGLMLVIVLGRLYGPAGVGVFALAQSIYLGAGILARYGMDNALMRYVGQDHHSRAIKTYLRWAMTKALALSLAAAIVIALLRFRIAVWFDSPDLDGVLLGISIGLPAFTLAFLLGGFMKGIRRPATACLLENGSIALVATGILLVLNHIQPIGIVNAGWAFAIAGWFVFGQGVWLLFRWVSTSELHSAVSPPCRQEFSASSAAFFFMSLSGFMQQVVSVLIAGWLLSSEDLGLFKSAERVALLISFIQMVINAVLPPRFARLYREGDISGLEDIARKGALIGVGLATPMSLVCLLFPGIVLGVFGAEFSQASNLLKVIAVAQLVNVATGSVGFLLSVSGYEKLMRNIALITNFLGLLIFLILIPPLGSLGAAIALALALLLQNLTALVFVWRKLGIWILPVPNFLSWMAIDRQEANNAN